MMGYESEEWELTGGDVQDALAWAAEHAGPDLDPPRRWSLVGEARTDLVGGH